MGLAVVAFQESHTCRPKGFGIDTIRCGLLACVDLDLMELTQLVGSRRGWRVVVLRLDALLCRRWA